jgi:hypothetical protein
LALDAGIGVAFTGASRAALVGVSWRRRERRTVECVAGVTGRGEVTDLDFRLSVGLDGVQRSIWGSAEAATGFTGEDLGLGLDLDGVAERSIPGLDGEGGGRGEGYLKWTGD